MARVDYSKPLSQTMDEYDAALEAGVQSGLKTILSAREQEAVDRMEEAIAEEDESELRFSFIGVVGAQNMDNADGGGRLDGLQVAQDMEAAGKGANVIKMATGWEVGADGKWRYEIPDLQYMGKLSNRWKKLGNFIYAPELFAAYPDLKDIEITAKRLAPHIGAGFSNDKIIVNSSTMNPLTLKSTLAHEIQHAIQVREGFARGDSFTITSGAPEIQNSRDEVKELIGFLMPTGIPDGLFYDLENIGKKSFVSLLKEILARAPGWKMFPAMTD